MTLDEYRRDFEISSNRSVSMPMAGALVWFLVAMASTQFNERTGVLILLFCSGTMFPIAVLIAKFRGETLSSSTNPLAKLMGLCVLMVNLLWALHIPLFLYAPTFVPLSLGIGLGLHWVVYSWIVQHPVGILHAVLRTVLVLLAWYSFPEQRLLAIGLAVVFVYCISIWQTLTRPLGVHVTTMRRSPSSPVCAR
ncbi:MAG: hypothetical protein V4603_13830 [Pseudomonadota bacterium]